MVGIFYLRNRKKKNGITSPPLILGSGIIILMIALALTFSLGYAPSLPAGDATSAETVTIVQNSTITKTLVENFSSVVVSNYTAVSDRTVTRVNTSEIAYLEHMISSLRLNVSSARSSESYYLSEASSLNSDLAQQKSLNSQLQSILNLQNSSEVASNVFVRQSAYESTLIASFAANYAGYVLINGTSSTSSGYIQFTDSFPSYPSLPNISFGSGFTTIVIPVLPGQVSIYFGNTNFFGSANANISAFYFI